MYAADCYMYFSIFKYLIHFRSLFLAPLCENFCWWKNNTVFSWCKLTFFSSQIEGIKHKTFTVLIQPKCTQRIFSVKLALEHLIFHQLFVFFCMDTIAIFLSFLLFSFIFGCTWSAIFIQIIIFLTYISFRIVFFLIFYLCLSQFFFGYFTIWCEQLHAITFIRYMYMQTGSKQTYDRSIEYVCAGACFAFSFGWYFSIEHPP